MKLYNPIKIGCFDPIISLPPSLTPPFSPSPSLFSLPPSSPRSDGGLHSLPGIRVSVHRVHITAPVTGQSACSVDLCQVPHGFPSLLPHDQRHQTSGETYYEHTSLCSSCVLNLEMKLVVPHVDSSVFALAVFGLHVLSLERQLVGPVDLYSF